MVSERKIIKDVVNRYLLKEYVKDTTERSGFGGIDIQRTPMGTLVTLVAERPGMVIGHRGKTIKELTSVMEHRFKFDNPQIEVEEEKKPNLNANIMAHKLAVALERGWHFRRAGHSTVRKIMGSGARGCQVVLAGKITGERHRTEKFKEGHIKYCGETALQTMEIGYAVAKKKLGTIGIKVMIMRPGAVLPDEIKILSQEEAKGIVPEAVVEELKIDTTIKDEVDEVAEDEEEEEFDLSAIPTETKGKSKAVEPAEAEPETAKAEAGDVPLEAEVEVKEPQAETTKEPAVEVSVDADTTKAVEESKPAPKPKAKKAKTTKAKKTTKKAAEAKEEAVSEELVVEATPEPAAEAEEKVKEPVAKPKKPAKKTTKKTAAKKAKEPKVEPTVEAVTEDKEETPEPKDAKPEPKKKAKAPAKKAKTTKAKKEPVATDDAMSEDKEETPESKDAEAKAVEPAVATDEGGADEPTEDAGNDDSKSENKEA